MSIDTTANRPSAAITGAGSGLGREIAIGLADKGYRVFGTALESEEVADVQHAAGGAARMTICDITDEAAVRSWANDTCDALDDAGLDVLISNAGILTPGPLEVLSIDAVRHEFDVNVFGSLAAINAFLPALRKTHGRIVQIGSMTGRLPLPFNGPSSASKAALEAFADVYRAELKPGLPVSM
jgi:NAD(P)-dependent dehydrogenase (short-subunit alcohol dehydrogenase family)